MLRMKILTKCDNNNNNNTNNNNNNIINNNNNNNNNDDDDYIDGRIYLNLSKAIQSVAGLKDLKQACCQWALLNAQTYRLIVQHDLNPFTTTVASDLF